MVSSWTGRNLWLVTCQHLSKCIKLSPHRQPEEVIYCRIIKVVILDLLRCRRIFADNNSSSIAIVQSSTEFLILFCHNLFLVIVCSVLFWQCWTKVKTRIALANLASRADPVSAHGFAYHTTWLWLTHPCKQIFHHALQINISTYIFPMLQWRATPHVRIYQHAFQIGICFVRQR